MLIFQIMNLCVIIEQILNLFIYLFFKILKFKICILFFLLIIQIINSKNILYSLNIERLRTHKFENRGNMYDSSIFNVHIIIWVKNFDQIVIDLDTHLEAL